MLSLKSAIKLPSGGLLRYEFIPGEGRHRVGYENGCWQHMWTQSDRKPAVLINYIAQFRDESEEVRELCAWLAIQAKAPWHQ